MAQKIKNIFLAVTAGVAGLINSLIGAGGGILLSLTLPSLAKEAFPDRRDAYINSQAAMIPGCALSCVIYSMRGMLNTVGFSLFAIPAAAGGAIGSFLLSKIKGSVIQTIFAVLVIWSGIRMIWG
ncbi:MAG: hypothetical protein E7649_06905 [Ruminococcaceae bacterium]|nr:hypothetical protein [Oscillospiraceae bacterium]